MYHLLDKPTLFKWVSVIVAAMAISLHLIMAPQGFSEYLRLITFTATVMGLIILFLSFTWRYLWRLFPSLNRWLFPDLNGHWRTEMRSNIAVIAEYHPALRGNTENSEIAGQFEIVQTLFSIDIVFQGDDGYSNSQTIFVKPVKDPATKRIFLNYLYENTTLDSLPTDEQYHAGAARLEIDRTSEFRKMNGVYWTNRKWSSGLNTAGTIKATKNQDA